MLFSRLVGLTSRAMGYVHSCYVVNQKTLWGSQMGTVEQALSILDWKQMSEVGWWDLAGLGLPSQLADLAIDMSRRSGRRIRVYAMPILEGGVAGLAVPFLSEDGIVFDTSLLSHADELANVIAHELAYMLYPGWVDRGVEEYGQMQRFAAALAPIIIDHLPSKVTDTDPMVEVTLCNQWVA